MKFIPSPMPKNEVAEARKQPRLIKNRDGSWTVESGAEKNAVQAPTVTRREPFPVVEEYTLPTKYTTKPSEVR
jgi:hypothetical protein